MRNSQSGASLLATMSIVLLISFVCGFILSRWTQISHHNEMVALHDTMQTFFERYREQIPVLLRDKKNLEGALGIQSYHLMDTCKVKESMFNKANKVCTFGLGEIEVKSDYIVSKLYNYVYVHFTDIYKRNSCKQFLSEPWEKILPKSWWGEEGYIGVISENTKGKIYFSYNDEYIRNDGAETNPTRLHIKEVCNVCRHSRYCSILFFFVTDENTLHNT